jgi:hypothetical protein
MLGNSILSVQHVLLLIFFARIDGVSLVTETRTLLLVGITSTVIRGGVRDTTSEMKSGGAVLLVAKALSSHTIIPFLRQTDSGFESRVRFPRNGMRAV